ncbi:MAG: SulP family inorganic anion transporter [Cyanobacteria bacterium P01_H01_bin.74]
MLMLHQYPLFPTFFQCLKQGYAFSQFKADFIAGLTLAIVALPLSMALAIASGAGPVEGLITAFIGGSLVAMMGGARFQIAGPTGAFVVIVYKVIETYGYGGLLTATVLAGLLLILAGFLKWGKIIKYIPYPVVTGFIGGIAVIIVSSQIKDFFGLPVATVPADFFEKWAVYLSSFDRINSAALGLGLSVLALITGLKKFTPKLPAFLIAVVVAAVATYWWQLPVETIGSRFPDIASGLPVPRFPELDLQAVIGVLPAAFSIAFLAGVEGLLCAVVSDEISGDSHQSNQELVGQGLANIFSAVFGGIPVTADIARTSLNIRTGCQTPVAGLLHAGFVFLFMLVGMPYIGYIPMACLAAILFVVAWNMSEIRHFVYIYRISKSDRAIMLITFALTVVADLSVAIVIGAILSSFIFMAKMSRLTAVHPLSVQEETAVTAADFKQADKTSDLTLLLPPEDSGVADSGVAVFKINGPLFFGAVDALIEALKMNPVKPHKAIVIKMDQVPYIDATGAKALMTIVSQYCRQNAVIVFSNVPQQPARIIHDQIKQFPSNQVAVVDSFPEAVRSANALIS